LQVVDLPRDVLADDQGCALVAITRFSFNGEDVDLVYLNRADFLPPELVTY
jgi:hypothetical protein